MIFGVGRGGIESDEEFAELYREFRRPIRQYVGEKVFDDESAEELTQEIFLKAYRHRASYRPEYAASTWLWTIARNTVFDHLRARASSVRGANHPVGAEAVSPEECPSGDPSAESRLILRARGRGFIRILRPLTRPQKRVIWMRIIHQLSYHEIAGRMGLTLGAVKNLAYRARVALRSARVIYDGRRAAEDSGRG